MNAASAAAALGELLDVKDPGWWQRVDEHRLDMADPALCVAGQACTTGLLHRRVHRADLLLSGTGDHALRYLACMKYHTYTEWVSGLPAAQRAAWSIRHGFLASYSGYPALTAAVREQIIARKRSRR